MPRLFTDVLGDASRGHLVAVLTDDYAELVTAVRDTGRPGELTIKIKVSPNKGDTEVLLLSADRSLKLPKKPLPDSIFFPGEDGSLLRDDPRQRVMFSVDGANDDASDAKRAVPRSPYAD